MAEGEDRGGDRGEVVVGGNLPPREPHVGNGGRRRSVSFDVERDAVGAVAGGGLVGSAKVRRLVDGAAEPVEEGDHGGHLSGPSGESMRPTATGRGRRGGRHGGVGAGGPR